MKKIRRIIWVILPLAVLALCLGVTELHTQDQAEDVAALETLVPETVSAVPTTEPSSEPEPVFEEYDISLMALGDNLMHMGIVATGKQDDGSYDYSFLFEGMDDFLEQADIKVINQETILGGNERGFSGFPYFNSPTEVGDAIADAGFNVVLHATNHAADQNASGIDSCLNFWETEHPDMLVAGIHGAQEQSEADGDLSGGDANGTDTDIPLLTIEGVTFAILNYTYGPNAEVVPRDIRERLNLLCACNESSGLMDFTSLNPQVLEDIREAEKKADVVIVFPHWGTEYETVPSSYQEEFALQMTEAGADLIIGTHPHVPQPVEWLTADNGNTALCYYSLGNYVSTQKNLLSMLEEMAWITFHVTEDGVGISADHTGVVPLVCQYTSGPLRLDRVYLLEEYTEELVAAHGIHNWGGISMTLEDLRAGSQEIFGDWILKKEDVIQ